MSHPYWPSEILTTTGSCKISWNMFTVLVDWLPSLFNQNTDHKENIGCCYCCCCCCCCCCFVLGYLIVPVGIFPLKIQVAFTEEIQFRHPTLTWMEFLQSFTKGWRAGSVGRAYDSRSKDPRFKHRLRQEHKKKMWEFSRVKNVDMCWLAVGVPNPRVYTHT